jgi:hypothetical protein
MRRSAAVLIAALLAVGCSGAGRPELTDQTPPDRECSADGMTVGDLDSDGLPSAVARTRQELVDAAVQCDYRSLRRIARQDGLEVSFDGDVVPPAQWRDREAEGLAILRPLAGLLGLAYARQDGGFTWPTAVEWAFSDVGDDAERAALAEVVGEAGIYGWSDGGGYEGWRTTIGADGSWSSFYLGPRDGG